MGANKKNKTMVSKIDCVFYNIALSALADGVFFPKSFEKRVDIKILPLNAIREIIP